MSVAAAGGGMSGSDDDNGGGEKNIGKGTSEVPDHDPPASTDEDTDDEAGNKGKQKGVYYTNLHTYIQKKGLSSYKSRPQSFGKLTEIRIEDSKVGKKENPIQKKPKLLKRRGKEPMPSFSPDHPNNKDEDKDDDNKGNNAKKKKMEITQRRK